ncbi:hypothetical protein HGRIS_008605 [Hohenbuehelia grisea]|uniref:Uncharacterized protein n=1 Tax=Hohenbuehelia grisea TaxID=104357 RepID=A0ABR3J8I6_9AGAR
MSILTNQLHGSFKHDAPAAGEDITHAETPPIENPPTLDGDVNDDNVSEAEDPPTKPEGDQHAPVDLLHASKTYLRAALSLPTSQRTQGRSRNPAANATGSSRHPEAAQPEVFEGIGQADQMLMAKWG